MFPRLGLHGIVRCYDEQCQVHAGGPGQHIANKPFVAGNVDDAEPKFAKIQFGESQFDRNAASLFLRKSISVDASEGSNQGRLAVVDVPRCAQD
jgi:hypothetical protein